MAQQCDERHVYLSPATLVIVPNTMLVPHWKGQIQVCAFSCLLLRCSLFAVLCTASVCCCCCE